MSWENKAGHDPIVQNKSSNNWVTFKAKHAEFKTGVEIGNVWKHNLHSQQVKNCDPNIARWEQETIRIEINGLTDN